jgi:branched-chain amino acid transport system permease protein
VKMAGKASEILRFFSSLYAKKLYFFSILVLVIFLLAIPHLVTEYIRYVIIICLIYGILTLSYNLVMGYTGQLSFCHAAFYGIGAYTSVLLTGTYIGGVLVSRSLSFWVAFPIAGILSAVFAAAVGFPALRLRGSYFAVTTFFFSWFVYLVFLNWTDVTNGPLGLRGVPPPDPILGIDFRSSTPYYYLVLGVFMTTTLLLYYLINSNIGKIFVSIREEETLAESLGINAMKYKVLSFTIGAFFAGLAGSLFAHFIRFNHPSSFSWYESDIVLVMTVVGGCGTIIGPIIGAGIVQALFELLRPIDPGLRMILVFAASIIVVVLEPRGIVGTCKRIARILRS